MKVKEAASALENMETNMGEVPEEFLDPVLGTVMNDPVTLPNSKVTLDRTTIIRHLLRYTVIITICNTFTPQIKGAAWATSGQ